MDPIDQLDDDEWAALVRRALAMPDAPPHAVRGAIDLWRQHRPMAAASAAAASEALGRRWIALLTFDSWSAAPQTAGMRALPSEVRQLVYTTEICDIDLRVAPLGAGGGGAGYSLSGQLLGPFTEGRVLIAGPAGSPGGAAAVSAALDALGEFHFEGASEGTYRISVHVGAGEIELPPLEVGPSRDAGP